MKVAGLGCRKGVSAGEVLAAIAAACAECSVGDLDALATVEAKRAEPALAEAALRLGLPLRIAGAAAVARSRSRLRSFSAASLAAANTPSASEAAALAVAGPGARLLGPRLAHRRVTCAIAVSGDLE